MNGPLEVCWLRCPPGFFPKRPTMCEYPLPSSLAPRIRKCAGRHPAALIVFEGLVGNRSRARGKKPYLAPIAEQPIAVGPPARSAKRSRNPGRWRHLWPHPPASSHLILRHDSLSARGEALAGWRCTAIRRVFLDRFGSTPFFG